MSITVQQSRLVDEKSKQKHIDGANYDYSLEVQSQIQSLVEANIEFEDMLRSPDLIPRVGTTNGVKVTTADRDAYIAAHPQNAARKSDRSRIADIIAAGGSTIDDTPAEEPGSELPDKIYPTYPQLPVEQSGYSTHFAVAVTPGYSKPIEDRENIYRIIEASENLVVIDDYVGAGGEFAYVKSKINLEYKPFYIKKNAIALIDESAIETPFDLDAEDAEPTGGEIPEWTSLPANKPIKFSQIGAYVISVTLDDEVLDGDTTDDGQYLMDPQMKSVESYKWYLEQGFDKGITKILKFNKKRHDIEYITEQLIESDYWDRPAKATEVYLPTRQGAKIKVFVKIPIRTIAMLEDEEKPDWEYTTEYDISSFKEKIKKVSDKISSMKSDIEKYDGKVLEFSPEKEKNKFEKIPEDLQFLADKNSRFLFMKKNGKIKEGKFKIYWDANMKPVIFELHLKSESDFSVLKDSFGEFTERISCASKRTQWMLLSLDNIIEDIDIPWEDFLYDWVRFKEVKIVPNTKEDKVDAAEGSLVKTKEELEREDRLYNDVNKKIEEKKKREKQSNSVGSPNINNSKFMEKKSLLNDGVDSLYDNFLNNVDFRKMTFQALSCALQELPFDAFNRIQNDYKVLKKESDRLKKEKKEGKLLDFLYPDELPTDDISEAFFKTLGSTLGTMVSTTLSSMINSVFSSLFQACNEKAEVTPPFPEPLQIGDSLKDLAALAEELFGAGVIDSDTIANLMNDLANLLSPSELCNLLRGTPDRETLDIIQNLLDTSYCELGLDTDEEIINFFLTISQGMDLSICDEIEEIIDSLPDDFLCPPSSLVRERLLADKNMTPEQIQDQLDRERERSKKLAEQFLKDLRDSEIVPNLFCSKDELGNTIPGEISFMDEQFEYTLETTLGSLFKNIYDSFTMEGQLYIQNLIVEQEEPVIINEVETLVAKRKVIPHLTKFYESGEIKDGSSEKQFAIEIPTILSSEIENVNLFLEEEFTMPKYNTQTSETLEKIVFSESVGMLPTSTPNPEPQPQPPEEPVQTGNVNVKENGCIDNVSSPIRTFTQDLERDISISDFDVPETVTMQNSPLNIFSDMEEQRGKIDYSIKLNRATYSQSEELPQNIIEFFNTNMGSEESIDSVSLLQAVLNYSIKNNESLSSSQKENEKNLVSINIEVIYKSIRDSILEYLTGLLADSKYLQLNSSAETPDGSVVSERYILEYINLGPAPTPACDPHLLKIKQLIEDLKNNLQGEMCLDFNSLDSSAEPKLTPLEEGMMKACIRAIVRHYTIETCAKSILTTTRFQVSNQPIDNIKARYICDKIKESMNEYSSDREGTAGDCDKPTTFTGEMPSYYEDFLEQIKQVMDGKSIIDIVREEYGSISEGFHKALLINPTRISLKSYISSFPEIVEDVGTFITGKHVSFSDSSLNSKIAELPHFVKYNGHFCIMIDSYPVQKYKRKFSNNVSKYIVPVAKVNSFDSALDFMHIQKALFNYCFPIEKYISLLSIHEMETLSKMTSVQNAFGETRDNLFSLFYAILPERNDWRKQDKSISSIGGTSGYTKMFDFNNNVYDTPCTDFSFNLGNSEVCWGNSFKGLSMATALRLARDAALKEFKKYVERNDPAVKLAKRLSFLSKLACVNIPTSAIAGVLNNTNPILFPPTPIAAAYHALGLGVFLPSSMLNSDSEEGAKARKEITDAQLALPDYCGTRLDDSGLQTDALQQSSPSPEASPEDIQSQIISISLEIAEVKETIDSKINNNSMVHYYAHHLGDIHIAGLRQLWVQEEIIPAESNLNPQYREEIATLGFRFEELKQELERLTSL